MAIDASWVPKMRFCGEDEEVFSEWEEVRLGDVTTVVSGGTPDTEKDSYWDGNVIWLTPTEINKEKYVNSSKRTLSQEGLKNCSAKVLPVGTILLTTRATLGEMAITTKPLSTNQGFQSLIPGENVEGEFLYYMKPIFKKHFHSKANGSTFKEIGKKEIQNLLFYSPSLPEQQKIAAFLTTLDRHRDLQQQRVVTLHTMKQGWLHQLFNQTVRFLDEQGEVFPEWGEVRLGDVTERKRKGKEAVYVQNGNLLLHNAYLESGKDEKYVSNPVDVYVDDILVLWDGSQAGLIHSGTAGVLGSTLVAFSATENCDSQFLFQKLKGNEVLIKNKWREGSIVPHVSKDFFTLFSFKLPALPEQQKIATFLTTLDQLIELEERKLAVLDTRKQAFLQQLFV